MTEAEARDEMMDLLNEAWLAGPPSETVSLLWEDVPGSAPSIADPNAVLPPWARAQVRFASGGQVSLAASTGNRLFRRSGIITVQVFTPKGDGLNASDALARIARDAYEGETTPGGVWFRDARIQAVGVDGAWYQQNVLVDFEYDEVK